MGLPWLLVIVDEVIGGVATVHDQLGQVHQVSANLQRTKGGQTPSPGDRWIVDRALGNWTFAAVVTSEDSIDPADLQGELQTLQTDLSALQAMIAVSTTGGSTLRARLDVLQTQIETDEALFWMR